MIGTAYWIAAARARESARPDALFRDPYAAALAGERGRTLLARSEAASGGGENVFLPIRTRYFDDALLDATSRIPQVVLLGAGFDTRAFRLPLPQAVTVYEIDRAEIFAEKEPALAAAGARAICARHTIAADLATAAWLGPLRDAGLDPSLPTAWLAEGLLLYLSEPAVSALLREAAGASPRGSLFLADVFGTGLRRMVAWDAFCTDDPAGMLEAAGWTPQRITGPGAGYGRLRRSTPAAAPQDPTMRAHLLTATR